MNQNLTSAEQLSNLQNRLTKLNNEKVSAQTSLKHLREQYDQKIAHLKSLGVENTKNLSEVVVELENTLQQELIDLDVNLTQIEDSINNG